MSKYFLEDDLARCENEKCSKKNTCARYLDVLPFELYWFSTFPDTDCDYYIEKINEATTTKQLTLF